MSQTSVASLSTELKALRESAKAKAKSLFEIGTKEIFEKHPKLESWKWHQYTPYFNDGDACEFSVNRDYLTISFNGKEFEDLDNSTFRADNEYAQKYQAEALAEDGLKNAFEHIKEMMDAMDEDDFKQMFGDHMEVTVTKSGAVAEEYEHD